MGIWKKRENQVLKSALNKGGGGGGFKANFKGNSFLISIFFDTLSGFGGFGSIQTFRRLYTPIEALVSFVRKYEIKNFLQGDLQDFQHGGFWLLWNFSMALNIHQRASFIFFGNNYEISNLLIVPSSEILNGFAQLSKMCILVNLGLPMALQTHRGVAFNFRRHIKKKKIYSQYLLKI